MKFFELLQHLPNVTTTAHDVEITAPVTERVQDLQPGGVFVARKGAAFDGHTLIPQAVQNGAAAVIGELPLEQIDCLVPYAIVPNAQGILGLLAEVYFDFPSRKLVVIGVTGTDGKTTTVSIIFNILKTAGIKAGLISTVSAVLGDRELETGLHVTTPTAPEVQDYLAQMVEAGMTHCVLEATSHGLAQGRVDGVDFDIAVLTNVMHEHLDYHGSWEAYREAKAKLFHKLSQSVYKPGQDKIAVINADDPSAGYFGAIPAGGRLTYSISLPGVNFYASDVRILPDGTHFRLGTTQVRSPLFGGYNLSNVLAAMAAASAAGVPMEAIVQGVASVPQIPGRMERISAGQDFLAVVDFAHTPNSLRQVLTTARGLIGAEGRVICVVGSAGLRDKAKRRMMAEAAGELADFTVFTAEDPRTESLDDILAEMAAGCASVGRSEGEDFIRVPDRGAAIYRACMMARRGDVVLACGKGHEQSMCFGETEYPWDDRDAMRAALAGTPLSTLPTAAEAD